MVPCFAVMAWTLPTLAQDEFDSEFDEVEVPAGETERPPDPGSATQVDDGFAPASPPNDVDGTEREDAFTGESETFEPAPRPEADSSSATRTERPGRPQERQRFQLHNSYFGPTGGLFAVDARTSRADSFRLQLLARYYSGSDFLVQGDSHELIGGAVSMSWGLLDWLEIFGSLDSYSNSNNREDPSLIQVIGDVRVGAKVGFSVLPWLSVGGDAALFVPTSSELDPSFSGVGGRFRANATADFRNYEEGTVPLIVRLNAGYDLDNSANVIEDIERARYDALDAPRIREDETRNLVTAVERFSLGVNRTDFVRLAIGLEAPFEPIDDLVIAPLAEYLVGIPVNRQGFDCPFIPAFSGSSRPPAGEDGCLDRTGLDAIPMDLILGVRVLPPLEGLSALLAVEIGITGTDPEDQVRELAGNAPWTLYLGAGFAFDVRSTPAPIEFEITEREERGAPPPAGRIAGRVVDDETNQPVPNARVHYIASGESDQLTDAAGVFHSAPLDPGTVVSMEVTAPDYEPGQCEGTVPESGGDVDLSCGLSAVLAPVIVEEGEVVVLEKINFAFDSAEILPSSFGLLDSIAETLQEHREIELIEVQGHTDDQGSERYNQRLSEQRAASVERALLQRGIDEERLQSRGFGLSQPIVPNDSEENRGKNRRVQFIILRRADLEP